MGAPPDAGPTAVAAAALLRLLLIQCVLFTATVTPFEFGSGVYEGYDYLFHVMTPF